MTTFVKKTWSNEHNGPITPAEFNRIENGIEEAINLAGQSGVPANLLERIENMETAVSNLSYKQIELSSASIQPSSAAIGGTVTEYTVSYSFNKTPSLITLKNGNTAVHTISEPSSASGTIGKSSLSITEDLTLTLQGTDERNATASKNLKIEFMNYAYYGAANSATVTSAFVNALASKALTKTKARTITVNAAGSKYIWYAIPSRLGTPVFTVGGFEGGFSLASTLQVTNDAGYEEEYKVYKSDNPGLGSTKVVIS